MILEAACCAVVDPELEKQVSVKDVGLGIPIGRFTRKIKIDSVERHALEVHPEWSYVIVKRKSYGQLPSLLVSNKRSHVIKRRQTARGKIKTAWR